MTIDEIQTIILNPMDLPENVSHGAAGFFAANTQVDSEPPASVPLLLGSAQARHPIVKAVNDRGFRRAVGVTDLTP